MTGQHGASPKFHAPDNMAEAITLAAEESGITIWRARKFLATFFRQWTGPRGNPGTPLPLLADRIEGLPS